ncbi:single-stranded DNA-binding protein, mitochondrial isoform X1 [Gossypium australe]|uniref:Single-stranded DNA-binding protein, mitochondrial isoform X1 n=1 Tax=Gossypium australe TaxID=47621 RepID=A0A5B6VHL3_9ROSI|nr:single-stranded DNA-binding protein, mitochondrial isoform X1 [Gossypium australe]
MSSFAIRSAKLLRLSVSTTRNSSLVAAGVQRTSKMWYSTGSLDDFENEEAKNEEIDEILGDKPNRREPVLQGVRPGKGWNFRGVHKAILCGKVGQAPVQKILRNGRTITIFTVGTGGMFDLRVVRDQNTPKPVQWHRIAVHNDILGAYAVQQVTKNSQVFVEGDIETRVYNDSINGEVKHVPEICIRRNGRIRVIKPGTGVKNISFDDLSEGLV